MQDYSTMILHTVHIHTCMTRRPISLTVVSVGFLTILTGIVVRLYLLGAPIVSQLYIIHNYEMSPFDVSGYIKEMCEYS